MHGRVPTVPEFPQVSEGNPSGHDNRRHPVFSSRAQLDPLLPLVAPGPIRQPQQDGFCSAKHKTLRPRPMTSTPSKFSHRVGFKHKFIRSDTSINIFNLISARLCLQGRLMEILQATRSPCKTNHSECESIG